MAELSAIEDIKIVNRLIHPRRFKPWAWWCHWCQSIGVARSRKVARAFGRSHERAKGHQDCTSIYKVSYERVR